MKLLLFVGMTGCLSVASVLAQPVGETHRVTSERTASLRDAQHRDLLRITVWYSAAADAVEGPVVEGPTAQPLFDIGAVAPNAPFATDNIRLPVLLLSHGFGGTARIMGWFGMTMARTGYIVIAVDHPGSNAIDEMTVPGAILWWDRTEDLQSALEAALRDPTIGPHMDTSRTGVAASLREGLPLSSRQALGPIQLTSICFAVPIRTTGCVGRNWSSPSHRRILRKPWHARRSQLKKHALARIIPSTRSAPPLR